MFPCPLPLTTSLFLPLSTHPLPSSPTSTLTPQQKKREYYLKNKEAILERTKAYYHTHKLHNKPKRSAYYQQNKLLIQQRNLQYRSTHSQALKQTLKIYYLHNKHLIKEKRKASLRLRPSADSKALLYRLRNKERIKEAARLYRTKHHLRIKLNLQEYYLKYKHVFKKRGQLYRLKHRDALKKHFQEYYVMHKELLRLKNKEYRVKHTHLLRLRKKVYCRDNKEKVYLRMKLYRTERKKERKNRVWKDLKNVRGFFEMAGERLFVSDPKEWYRVSRAQISQVGGAGMLTIFGNLGKALCFGYPEVDWDQAKFSVRAKKSSQRWLRVVLEQILPRDTLIVEDYLHPDLLWDEGSNHKMELDIWVPTFNLALEYQGEQHYHDVLFFGSFAMSKERDLKKKNVCESKGISLLHVPFWWDRTKESLWTLLVQFQPDLIFKTKVVPLLPLQPLYQNTT